MSEEIRKRDERGVRIMGAYAKKYQKNDDSMGDLPDNPSVGDFYSVKNLDGKVKTVYFAHGWKELGREV